MLNPSMIHASAEVHSSTRVGIGVKIWKDAQVREGAVLGDFASVGKGAYIGPGVLVGANCKIQNAAQIFEPALLERGVFIGPGAILTNDHNPRAVTSELILKSPQDWVPVGVTILEGASIGAGAICIAPIVVGRWAMVGAGAVVTRNVPAFALVLGNPAKQVAWIGRSGHRLVRDPNQFELLHCPLNGSKFIEIDSGTLKELD